MQPMRILVVDDLRVNRMLMSKFLEDIGEVSLAVNGAEAVMAAEEALITEDPYDLICLDINMPVMDGLEALHTIRAAEQRHGARRSVIFMVTASSSPDHMLRSLENEGCDNYIVKPVLKKTLMALLRDHGIIDSQVQFEMTSQKQV